MMKYTEYIGYVSEAAKAESPEAVLAEYGYPADCPYDVQTLEKVFQVVWAAAHKDVRMMVDLCGGNKTAFARRFGIPLRSIENWCSGDRQSPDYVAELIGYAIIGDFDCET